MLPGLVALDRELEALRRNHRDWYELHLIAASALYALPEKAVATEAIARLFGAAHAAAERDFTALCLKISAIGVDGNRPLLYPPLFRTPLQTGAAYAPSPKWAEALRIASALTAEFTRSINERLLGVAGRFVTEPAFLSEVRGLRAAWESLPHADRPPFPLARPVPIAEPPIGAMPACVSAATFNDLLVAFLNRWGLISLVDWHLPLPQGPLLPSPLATGAAAEPHHGIRINLPIHYPLLGDDALIDRITRMQAQAAKEAGVPAVIGPIRHYEQYAQMFRLFHLETAVESRFRADPPRGYVTQLRCAAAAELGVSPGTVTRMRRWIGECRDGGGDRIRPLPD